MDSKFVEENSILADVLSTPLNEPGMIITEAESSQTSVSVKLNAEPESVSSRSISAWVQIESNETEDVVSRERPMASWSTLVIRSSSSLIICVLRRTARSAFLTTFRAWVVNLLRTHLEFLYSCFGESYKMHCTCSEHS
jgi:hypothetical protein